MDSFDYPDFDEAFMETPTPKKANVENGLPPSQTNSQEDGSKLNILDVVNDNKKAVIPSVTRATKPKISSKQDAPKGTSNEDSPVVEEETSGEMFLNNKLMNNNAHNNSSVKQTMKPPDIISNLPPAKSMNKDKSEEPVMPKVNRALKPSGSTTSSSSSSSGGSENTVDPTKKSSSLSSVETTDSYSSLKAEQEAELQAVRFYSIRCFISTT